MRFCETRCKLTTSWEKWNVNKCKQKQSVYKIQRIQINKEQRRYKYTIEETISYTKSWSEWFEWIPICILVMLSKKKKKREWIFCYEAENAAKNGNR